MGASPSILALLSTVLSAPLSLEASALPLIFFLERRVLEGLA